MNEDEFKELVEREALVSGDQITFVWPGGEAKGRIVTNPVPQISSQGKHFLSFAQFVKNFQEIKENESLKVLINSTPLSDLNQNGEQFEALIQRNKKKKQDLLLKHQEIEKKIHEIDGVGLEQEIEKLEHLKSTLEKEAKDLRKKISEQKADDEQQQQQIFVDEVQTKIQDIKNLLHTSDGSKTPSPVFDKFQKQIETEINQMSEKLQSTILTLANEIHALKDKLAVDLQTFQHSLQEEVKVSNKSAGDQNEDRIQQAVSSLHETIKSLPPAELSPEILQAEKDKKELEHLKSALAALNEEVKKNESELKNLKAQESALSTPQRERRASASEAEVLKKSIAEEEQEKKRLQAQLQELRENAKVLEDQGCKLTDSHTILDEKSLEINYHEIKIVKRIGGGGFAEVFEGIFHGERVAVKKMLAQSWDQGGRKELEKEAQIMCNSHSSYIVRLYGFSLYPPNMCMVMEFFPRGSLAYILWDKNVALNWNRKWEFARDAALALNYLHTRNPPILHRDIKAGNYLVSSDWRLKLTDFGCSIFKGTEEKKETEGEKENFIGGTFGWTAPEVLSGEPYNEKADVYSYAMVLYEIASRKQPWDEYTSPDEQFRVRNWVGEGKRPNLPLDTPQDFKVLIGQAWEHDINKRSTMPTILKQFERKGILTGEISPENVDSWFEAKARLQEDVEQQKQLKETFENRTTEAEKELSLIHI
eukprot:TRINITY_DN1381_c0_g1_i4.p1 TRINITY_DN1381_c0_g1~~TRINITY_DN1381_c0_g1_i4.p1  ORF type:complete len:734 (-),score=234.13 TRINITY_DN1381_c0_g1_i4:40-2157(-)